MKLSERQFDFIVIGAGVVGLSVARALLRSTKNVLVIEKEFGLGFHASGRNSGVLHAGLYYPPDTLKAKFSVLGAKQVKDYCLNHDVPLQTVGKVIVAQQKEDLVGLEQVYSRAKANGVQIRKIDQDELKRIEPLAKSFEYALHSPTTSVIEPKSLLEALRKEILRDGGHIEFETNVFEVHPKKQIVVTSKSRLNYGHLINAAGTDAIRVAHSCGIGQDYESLPFKGIYYQLSPSYSRQIRGLIYPVVELRMPFLGVHFTKSIDGLVKIGPSAIPAFGLENYDRWIGGSLSSIINSGFFLTKNLISGQQGMRRYAFREMTQLGRLGMFRSARRLVQELQIRDVTAYRKVGIRPQLVNKKNGELVMDFLVEKGESSTHILNTISPGLTASLPFGEWIVENLL